VQDVASRRRTGAVGIRGKRRTENDAGSRFSAKALDPTRTCGPGTSVKILFRIDESSAGHITQTHLVFFDRHGWYCEHGRHCPAVPHAQREAAKAG